MAKADQANLFERDYDPNRARRPGIKLAHYYYYNPR